MKSISASQLDGRRGNNQISDNVGSIGEQQIKDVFTGRTGCNVGQSLSSFVRPQISTKVGPFEAQGAYANQMAMIPNNPLSAWQNVRFPRGAAEETYSQNRNQKDLGIGK